ncbi:hypothetical protein E3N88_13536 [Mikania micrantha]|uniref:Uncharacterized protein n=1 Tax=Mikania micrantha TaxID=192012 RepID=A0A5N6PB57_9ASTR|nr:hypothetical protein E3N88_13536 [Mikania micrantha]
MKKLRFWVGYGVSGMEKVKDRYGRLFVVKIEDSFKTTTCSNRRVFQATAVKGLDIEERMQKEGRFKAQINREESAGIDCTLIGVNSAGLGSRSSLEAVKLNCGSEKDLRELKRWQKEKVLWVSIDKIEGSFQLCVGDKEETCVGKGNFCGFLIHNSKKKGDGKFKLWHKVKIEDSFKTTTCSNRRVFQATAVKGLDIEERMQKEGRFKAQINREESAGIDCTLIGVNSAGLGSRSSLEAVKLNCGSEKDLRELKRWQKEKVLWVSIDKIEGSFQLCVGDKEETCVGKGNFCGFLIHNSKKKGDGKFKLWHKIMFTWQIAIVLNKCGDMLVITNAGPLSGMDPDWQLELFKDKMQELKVYNEAMLNIWESRNNKEKKMIPHCKPIQALIRWYGLINDDDHEYMRKHHTPFRLNTLAWEYKSSERYHRLTYMATERVWDVLKVNVRPLQRGKHDTFNGEAVEVNMATGEEEEDNDGDDQPIASMIGRRRGEGSSRGQLDWIREIPRGVSMM